MMCQENDNACPPLRNQTRNPDEYNNCDANELCEDNDKGHFDCNTDELCTDNDNGDFIDNIDHPSLTNNDDDSSTLLDIDYDDYVAHYEDVVDWKDVMSSGNDVSNTSFEQDLKCFMNMGNLIEVYVAHVGGRDIVWIYMVHQMCEA